MDVPVEQQNDLNKYLINLCQAGEIFVVIQGLQSALRETLDDMDEKVSPNTADKELKTANAVLSKIVLFSVRDEWMQQHHATMDYFKIR